MAHPENIPQSHPSIPASVHFEPELQQLSRIASWIGSDTGEAAPLTYLSLLLAYLAGDGPVSNWFRAYITATTRSLLFDRLQVADSTLESYRVRARTYEPPAFNQLFSQSAVQLFDEALAIAVGVAGDDFPDRPPPTGTRHVMCAYAFSSPPNHLKDLLQLGFDLSDWQTRLLTFLRQEYPTEDWNWFVDKKNAARNTLNLNSAAHTPSTIANTGVNPDSGILFLNTTPEALGTASIIEKSAETATENMRRYIESPTDSSESSSTTPAVALSDAPPPLQTPNFLISRYTADDPDASADDALDIDTEAAGFARIVAARSIRPPLAIGIFGEWGSGKTYFMRRIQSQVETLRRSQQATTPTEPLFYSEIAQIRFNAWHYIETNLWASLVEYIFSALDTWIQAQANGDPASTDLVFNRLATAQQLQIDALEKVVQLRAQQHSAALRAQRARDEYNIALANSERLKPDTSMRAMLKTFLSTDTIAKAELKALATDLGIPNLELADERLTAVLTESRTTAGHARLITRSLMTKLGTVPGFLAVACIILAFPVLSTSLTILADHFPNTPWAQYLRSLTTHTTLTLLITVGLLQHALNAAKAAVNKLTAFDAQLQKSIDEQVEAAKHSKAAKIAAAADQELMKAQQAYQSADRALNEANVKLSAARQEFESGTARARLNAFVRAKVTDGNYAKHLGIIASIRKDFVQLASLMHAANDSKEEIAERHKLRQESTLRVQRFLSWLDSTTDIRLTAAEVRSLFALLEPDQAIQQFDTHRERIAEHFEDDQRALDLIKAELIAIKKASLPRFSRIVLYVDDLDRCPPTKVVEVLQAVHLLLCFPLFVVIVAVDARWVSRALHDSFPKLLAQTPFAESQTAAAATQPNGATSDDYLEKIFQIPYWVRSMEAKVASAYVQKIAGADRAQPPASSVSPAAAAPNAAPAAAGPAPPNPTTEPAGAAPGATSSTSSVVVPAAPNATTLTPTQLVTSMTLSEWEITALDAFAPWVGRTPRQAIRFVNIYRLIKTSLSIQSLKAEELEKGTTNESRALIPQLAIVTGSPYSAPHYFRHLHQADGEETAEAYFAKVRRETYTFHWNTDPGFVKVFETMLARETSLKLSAALKVKDLQFMAPTVQRYSFTARLAS